MGQRKIAISHAHSKLILVGEHAVVYGSPAIAVPFPLEVTSTVESRDGGIVLACSHYFGLIEKVPMELKGLAICIQKTLKYLKKPTKNLLIRLHSGVPIGRGLGSSAAIAIAIVKSLFLFYEKPILHEKLLELVQVAEVYAHGKPSGIDMAAASSDNPIWFQKEKAVQAIPVAVPIHIVVADSGKMSDTLSAVKKVREDYRLDSKKIKGTINKIKRIAPLAKAALSNGDVFMLGRLLDTNHQLEVMGVSDPSLTMLVQTARNEGALGAKMTGGGCGGCMIALAHSIGHAEQLAKKLLKVGAHKTWHFTIEENIEVSMDIQR